MLATGNSKLVFHSVSWSRSHDLMWPRVPGFHMDEYVGLPPTHPASFQRVGARAGRGPAAGPGSSSYLSGDAPDRNRRLPGTKRCCGRIRSTCVVPASGRTGTWRSTTRPSPTSTTRSTSRSSRSSQSRAASIRSRRAHFAAIDDVPTHAITVTIPALLGPPGVLVIAPEARKAKRPSTRALYGPISTACPASILRRQPKATLYLGADYVGVAPK